MIIKYSPAFFNRLKKVNVRVRKSIKQRILLFSKNPHDPQLNNHSLKREYKGHRSINITVDWRALYKEKREGKDMSHILSLSEPIRNYMDKILIA